MGKIVVVGLGLSKGDLSYSGYEKIKNANIVVARTNKAESFKSIEEIKQGVLTLDSVYQKSRNFDTLNKNLASEVIKLSKDNDVCYVVDGSAMEDRSVQEILKRKKDVEIIAGVSASTKCLEKLKIVNTACTTASCYDVLNGFELSYPAVIYAVDSLKVASDLKLYLLDKVGEDLCCYLTSNNGVKKIKIYEIDRQQGYDYSHSIYLPNLTFLQKQRFTVSDLLEILKVLRSPNGCPWDREQTPKSIEKNVIEESYELVEAVESGDDDKIIEEAGDMLLQVMFYITFGEESLSYNRTDVVSDICQKLISRHSHVFGNDSASSGEQALQNWNKNKQVEKGYNSTFEYVDAIPKNLPALLYSQKLLSRLEKSGYNYNDLDQDLLKIKEILTTIKTVENKEKSSGELLFLVNDLIRKLGVDSETALYNKSNEFLKEFSKSEN